MTRSSERTQPGEPGFGDQPVGAGTLGDRTTARRPVGEGRQPDDLGRRPEVKVVHSPDESALDWTLSVDETAITFGRRTGGRGKAIRDEQASRVHMNITWDARAKRHRVGDAGSTNGTFLNGRRVKSAALSSGDVIRIGDTILTYEFPNALNLVRARARQTAKCGLSGLILGETGTGKEVLAREIHDRSARPGPFVAINCAGLRPELIAAELFGHTRGAFSGADESRQGLFVAADGGTLFLDEVGELPRDVQAILLRALQERCIRPVGSDIETNVDVRVLSATNIDIRQATDDGSFRKDLYARLAELVFRLPPLRARRASVMDLLRRFLPEGVNVTPEAAEAMMIWDWPFNIREVQTLARSCAASLGEHRTLELQLLTEVAPELTENYRVDGSHDDLPESARSAREPAVSKEELEAKLTETRGNVTTAAKTFGVDRTQVYRWLRYFGLRTEDFR